jgi:hypothetical protein
MTRMASRVIMVLAVLVVAAGFPLVFDRSEVALSPSARQLQRCAFFYAREKPVRVPVDVGLAICAHQDADLAQRTVLSAAARQAGLGAATLVRAATGKMYEDMAAERHINLDPCRHPSGQTVVCMVYIGPLDPDRLPSYFARFGLVADIRVARDDDVAPQGSTLYGIDAGAACVTGYDGTSDVVGFLPGHRCLSS